MTKILFAILQSLSLLNPFVTLGGAVLTLVLGLFNFFNSMWAELLGRLSAVTLPTGTAASVMQGFDFVNYVFPLSELFTFCSAFMAFYVLCAAIRIVKSFVPSIA